LRRALGRQFGIVDIALRPLRVPKGGLVGRQLRLGGEALRQVRVGDERPAEADRVGLFRLQRGFRPLQVKSELSTSGPANALRIAGATGSTSALPNVPSCGGSRSSRKAMPISLSIAAAAGNRLCGSLSLAPCESPLGERRTAVRSGPDHPRHRARDFAEEPDAVLDRAAIIVVAAVGAVAQELVDQIAVGGVDLHAVEAGRGGVRGGAGIIVDDAGNLLDRQRARLGIRLRPS
jgi:hypothetical protein